VINETVQLLAAFAAHVEHGVNVMAQGIPRKNLDPLKPDDEAPPILSIADDVNDPGVANGLDPEEVPCFMMWGDSQAAIEVRGYKTAKEVVIAAAFVTDEKADPIAAEKACGYILRGGVITFGRFNHQPYSRGFRELNGIKILEIRSVTEQRVVAAVGRRKMWGFLDIRVTVIENLQ
jgi:hypothetical protein